MEKVVGKFVATGYAVSIIDMNAVVEHKTQQKGYFIMRKEGATLRNLLIIGGTIIGLVFISILIAKYVV